MPQGCIILMHRSVARDADVYLAGRYYYLAISMAVRGAWTRASSRGSVRRVHTTSERSPSAAAIDQGQGGGLLFLIKDAACATDPGYLFSV